MCLACHATLSGKKSIISSHIGTDRHAQGKARLEMEMEWQRPVKESFMSYQKLLGKDLVGTGLTEAVSTKETV